MIHSIQPWQYVFGLLVVTGNFTLWDHTRFRREMHAELKAMSLTEEGTWVCAGTCYVLEYGVVLVTHCK